MSLDNLAHVLEARGRPDQAEAVLGDARDQMQKQVDEFPAVPKYQSDLAAALNNLANLILERGRPAETISLLRQAIRYQEAVYRLNPRDTQVRTFLRNHCVGLTEALVALGDHAAAATAAEQLVRVRPGHPSDPYHAARFLARCVGLAAADPNLDTAARQAKKTAYADQAMKYLAQARKNGFRNTPGYIPRQTERPLAHKDLKPLEGLPEFQRLVADLTAEAAKGGK